MEYYNQAPESYYNQESESFYNQEPESFYTTAANVNVNNNNNNNNTTTTYYNRAAESFFIDEMRKLETEKALWKRDEQVLTKEVSRLNDRIQIEVEKRTDYEFEKATLQEELEAYSQESESLRRELRHKHDEVEQLRLRCADLENQLNRKYHQQRNSSNKEKQQQPAKSDVNYLDDDVIGDSWADRCKISLEEERGGGVVVAGGGRDGARERRKRISVDEESVFAPSSKSSADRNPRRASSTSSSDEPDDQNDDDDDDDGTWQVTMEGSDADKRIKSKRKSSTLTRSKEAYKSATRSEKTTNPGQVVKLNEVDDDLAALKQNIAVVNKKMQKNNIVITKLENCVQSLSIGKTMDK